MGDNEGLFTGSGSGDTLLRSVSEHYAEAWKVSELEHSVNIVNKIC